MEQDTEQEFNGYIYRVFRLKGDAALVMERPREGNKTPVLTRNEVNKMSAGIRKKLDGDSKGSATLAAGYNSVGRSEGANGMIGVVIFIIIAALVVSQIVH